MADTPKRKGLKKPTRLPIQPLPPGKSVQPGIGPIQEKLIGRVVTEWARLEGVMQEIVWRLLKLDFEDGRALTGRADADRLITILRSIAPRHVKEPKLEALLHTLDVVDQLREDRNFIVHGSWGTVMPDMDAISTSIRPKATPFEVVSEVFTHDQMRAIIKEILLSRKMLTGLINLHEPPSESSLTK